MTDSRGSMLGIALALLAISLSLYSLTLRRQETRMETKTVWIVERIEHDDDFERTLIHSVHETEQGAKQEQSVASKLAEKEWPSSWTEISEHEVRP